MMLIPRGKGLVTRRLKVQGTNSAGTSYVEFDNLICPVENLISPEHDGLRIVVCAVPPSVCISSIWTLISPYPRYFNNFINERLGGAFGAITRTVINDAIAYTSNRSVDGLPVIKKGVILHRLAKMAIFGETQQAWIESIVYQLDNLSKEEGSRLLGCTTALVKANCSLVLEPCASQALQIQSSAYLAL